MYSLCALCKPQRLLFSLSLHLFPKCPQFASPHWFLFCLSLHLFPKCPQFTNPNGFYSVFRRVCFPSVHSLQAQRFLFCLSPHVFSEWHIVPQLSIHIKQSRVYSRKALYGWKASRRLGKQMRGLYRFLSKPTLQHIPQ